MKQELYKPKKAILDVATFCKYTGRQDAKAGEYVNEWKRVEYDVVAFEVVSGEAAALIESESDGSCVDDFHEYLVLYFKDGDTATYRNSYVDLFLL